MHLAYLLACVTAGPRRGAHHLPTAARRYDRARRPRRLDRPGPPGARRPPDHRAQRHGLPPDVDDPLLRLLRAALLPLLLRLPAAGVHRRRHVRGRGDRVRRLRRACAARVVRDERRVLRRDERVLEAARVEGVRRRSSRPRSSPKDVAVGETIWAVVRAMLYSAAYLVVIVALGSRRLAVGAPRAAGVLRHRLRLRGRRYRGGHVDADVEGLRPDPAGHAADVHVLGDLLSDLRLPGGARVDRPLPAAVPRDRADPVAHDRHGGPFQLVNVAYLAAMGLVGMYVSSRRIDKLLLK